MLGVLEKRMGMNNLQKYRKKTKRSQSEFAKELGWGQSRIGNYEANVREPNISAAQKIVSKLNELGVSCSLEEVFPS